MTLSLTPAEIRDFADSLLAAARDRQPVEPLTDARPHLSVADAYAIQQEIVAQRRGRGEALVGWKLGLTSQAMQEQLGVSEPDYGPLLTGHLTEGGTVFAADLIAPRVEAEIAFVLARPLRGPGVTTEDVLAATEGVAASLEVIDSRVAAWRIRLADTIADMASSARIVVSDRVVPVRDVSLGSMGVVLRKNGDVVAEGRGSAVMGDPAAAVAWAANTLGRLGATLEAGHVVMPGAMHASVPAAPGDEFTAAFEGLGEVRVVFRAGGSS